MSEFHDAVTELIITAGRVSIDLPVVQAEELSLAISRATHALQAAAQPSAPITAEDVEAAFVAWRERLGQPPWIDNYEHLQAAFVAIYLNRLARVPTREGAQIDREGD